MYQCISCGFTQVRQGKCIACGAQTKEIKEIVHEAPLEPKKE